MADFTDSILVSGSTTLTMLSPTTDRHIQIDASDTGTLTISTKVTGKSVFTQQTTLAQGTIILDMIDVQELKLDASVGGVDFTVTAYRDQ